MGFCRNHAHGVGQHAVHFVIGQQIGCAQAYHIVQKAPWGWQFSSFSMLGKAKEFEELIPEIFMVASFMLMTRRGVKFSA